MLSGRNSNIRNTLSEGTTTVRNALAKRAADTKKWLKSKAKSKPFQWVISIGQGLSLGSSLHDALSKILSLSTLAGLAARVIGNVNLGLAGLTTFVMSYMTYTYVHTNITSESSTAEKLKEHEDLHEIHEKRFVNHQQSSVQQIQIMLREAPGDDDPLALDQYQISAELMQVLLQGNTESEASQAKIKKLLEKTLLNYATATQQHNAAIQHTAETQRLLKTHLDQTINNYVAFNQRLDDSAEEKHTRAKTQTLSISDSIDENYHPLDEVEMTGAREPSNNQSRSHRLALPSDRFFSSSQQRPAFPNSTTLMGSHPLASQTSEAHPVVIDMDDETKVADTSPRLSPRSMGGSFV